MISDYTATVYTMISMTLSRESQWNGYIANNNTKVYQMYVQWMYNEKYEQVFIQRVYNEWRYSKYIANI